MAASTSTISAEGVQLPTEPSATETFILRPATLADTQQMGEHASAAYWDSPVNRFLAPKADLYPKDVVRKFQRMIRRRYVNPSNHSIVACVASSPNVVVGYAQFVRLGDDEGALRRIREKGWWGRLCLRSLAWWVWAVDGLAARIMPDRSADVEVVKLFEEWGQKDDEKHWNSVPERASRWHAQSVVVAPAWQGKGIGRKMMGFVLEMAQQDHVVVGLTASPEGEKLYRKLGFEMLGDFYKRLGGDEDIGGGIMMWSPNVDGRP